LPRLLLMLPELSAEIGYVDIRMVELELNALIDRIRAGTTRCGGARIAVPQALDLSCPTAFELGKVLACLDHIRVLVGVLQQQLVEMRPRLCDTRDSVDSDGTTGAGTRHNCRSRRDSCITV